MGFNRHQEGSERSAGDQEERQIGRRTRGIEGDGAVIEVKGAQTFNENWVLTVTDAVEMLTERRAERRKPMDVTCGYK